MFMTAIPHTMSTARTAVLRLRQALRTVAATALVAAAACSSDAPTAVFDVNAPAQLALNASVRFQSSATATLRVHTRYLRTDETLVPLDSQSIALTDAASQQVPITVDLGACLRDGERAGSNGAAAAADECVVSLQLSLVTNGAVVDQKTLNNVSMSPGRTTSVSAPITLEEVGTIQLALPSANVVSPGAPLRLEATRTMTIGTTLTDGAGRPITRAVTWTSDNNTVATVTAGGVVTGVAAGTTRLTASIGSRSASVDVRVVPLPQTLTVTVGSTSSGNGIVMSSPAGITCTITGSNTTGTCSATFPGDASVTLTQEVGSNTTFIGWGGDCSGTTCTVSTSQARTVTATFRTFRTLTVSATGTGNGTITAPGGAINCVWRFGSASSGPCTTQIPDGAQITLTATPEANSQLTGWSGDCSTATGNSCTLTMSANRSAVAQFRGLTTFRITAGTSTGSGVITSSPSGMNCTVSGTTVSGTCALTVPSGTEVQLAANGSSGGSFIGWGGACANQSQTCRLTAPGYPGELGVTVGFERLASLTIIPDPQSTGTGQLNGTNLFYCQINGTSTSVPCQMSYPLGTQVTIDANRIGYTDFAQWGGACAGQFSNRCTLTLNGDVNATVRFEAVAKATLTTNLEGFGYSLRLVHPYESEQRCVRVTTNSSAPMTTCELNVPVARNFTLDFVVPSSDWYYYYYDGLCYDQYESTIPCVRRVNGDTATYTYAYPYSEGYRVPAGVRRSGAVRQPAASTTTGPSPLTPIRKSRGSN